MFPMVQPCPHCGQEMPFVCYPHALTLDVCPYCVGPLLCYGPFALPLDAVKATTGSEAACAAYLVSLIDPIIGDTARSVIVNCSEQLQHLANHTRETARKQNAITVEESRKFVENDLTCIDQGDYFKKVFGNGA